MLTTLRSLEPHYEIRQIKLGAKRICLLLQHCLQFGMIVSCNKKKVMKFAGFKKEAEVPGNVHSWIGPKEQH